jgi:hypothetical protein
MIPSTNTDGDVYIKLLTRDARDKSSAVLITELGVTKADLTRLLKDKRVKLTGHRYPRVYLTPLGYICAAGEHTARKKKQPPTD